ncbi:prepilin-type N-terminal cleavage/methylation domain-containing protein [Thermus igniterrae]|mgnify:CR=1 FL=1|jgi:prepilin-type N-terminal cleavage/methylation domain-containing protein|uniref:prepilin-type N-terminal cleavage/methylation domain-containing protein n=1 Tax=Thermus igniterrae TaxID=88189 RepID=UPI0003781021|nr:prepilin-type N-terminal cleavage/methylation domain-containing protein [Thermus igniterrae]
MAKGFTLAELALVLLLVGVLTAALVPRYVALQEEAQRAQRQETLRNLRSAYAMHLVQNRTVPTWNELKNLMGNPTPLRLSSSCPSGTTVAYWDHNGNALCNAGERLAYLYADEACQTFIIAVSATTVTVPIRCLRGHPDTLD